MSWFDRDVYEEVPDFLVWKKKRDGVTGTVLRIIIRILSGLVYSFRKNNNNEEALTMVTNGETRLCRSREKYCTHRTPLAPKTRRLKSDSL